MARFLREGLADDRAQEARENFAAHTARAFHDGGQVLDVGGWVLRDDASRGIGLAVRIGAALAKGSVDLLRAGNAYAAAALVRQLVEVEYLLWTFADDGEEAARWLHASHSQLDRFKPGAMRARSGGRFRSEEYRSHCERGGHPHPAGFALLRESNGLDPVRAGWVDLGQHLERGWGSLREALEHEGYGDSLTDAFEEVEQARARWHERDGLAARLRLPPGQ